MKAVKLSECKRIPAQKGFYASPNRREEKNRADFLKFCRIYAEYIATTHTVHCPAEVAREYGVHYGKEGELHEFLHKLVVGCYRQNDYLGRENGTDFRKRSKLDGHTYKYEVKCNASECGYYSAEDRVYTFDPENADFVVYCPAYDATMTIEEMLYASYVIPSEEFFDYNLNRPKNAFHENPDRNRIQVTNPRSSAKNLLEWFKFLANYETAAAHYRKHGYIK